MYHRYEMLERFEDTKGRIRNRNRRRTDNTMAKRKKKEKGTNNDLQNIIRKTKD